MADQFNPWDFFHQEFGDSNASSDRDYSDMSWVKEYVDNVMKQAFSGQFAGESNRNSVKSDVFETHHSIIIRIKVPDDIVAENVRVLFHTNELKVEGIASQPQMIKLPANGLYKGSKAMYKNSVLEVRIPKRNRETFQEIPIQY